MSVRVIVVDDHEVVGVGIRDLLERRADIECVGVATSAGDGVALARSLRPDVVVMDVRMPGMSGVEACREILAERPETRVVMLTSYADDDAVLASLLAGAAGYLLKDSTGEELTQAIELVAAGGSLLDPAVTGLVLDEIRSARSRRLTGPERRVLELISEGRTNRAIAAAMSLPEGSVRGLVRRVLEKTGAESRTELAVRVARRRAASDDHDPSVGRAHRAVTIGAEGGDDR